MKPHRALAVSLAASIAFAASAIAATAPADATRLSSQYSDWAGGKSNSDALVAGLRNGAAITLVTNGPDRSVSIAGFTPNAPMTYTNINSALSSAQRSLSRLGIAHPTAEQMQAALIGGEVLLPSGSSAVLRGTVVARGEPGPVATR